MSETHPTSHLWPGVPLALASAVLFGATAPLSKILLGVVDPQLLAGLLYLGAGIGLAGVHLARNAVGLPAPEAPLRPRTFRGLPPLFCSAAYWGLCSSCSASI